MVGVKPFRWAVVGLGALAIAVSSPAVTLASGTATQIRDLGTLGGSTSESVAINDLGQIAGSSAATDGSTHAFIWALGRGMRDLGMGTAVDINNLGQVVGNDAGRVFLWAPRTGRRDLGTLGGLSAKATDMNDRGQIVGSIDVTDGPNVVSHAFRWDPRQGLRDLGTGIATGINAQGQVAGVASEMVGFFWDPRTGSEPIVVHPGGGVTGFSIGIAGINNRGQVTGTALQAFVWDRREGARSLNTLDALSSEATAINNRGQVVGRVQDRLADVDHAFRWTAKSGMVDLTTGQNFAFNAAATGINDAGHVVGWTMTSTGPAGGEAFIWKDSSGLVHLGTLGGDSSAAVHINEFDWVAGSSTNAAGTQHAVVWIPGRFPR